MAVDVDAYRAAVGRRYSVWRFLAGMALFWVTLGHSIRFRRLNMQDLRVLYEGDPQNMGFNMSPAEHWAAFCLNSSSWEPAEALRFCHDQQLHVGDLYADAIYAQAVELISSYERN